MIYFPLSTSGFLSHLPSSTGSCWQVRLISAFAWISHFPTAWVSFFFSFLSLSVVTPFHSQYLRSHWNSSTVFMIPLRPRSVESGLIIEEGSSSDRRTGTGRRYPLGLVNRPKSGGTSVVARVSSSNFKFSVKIRAQNMHQWNHRGKKGFRKGLIYPNSSQQLSTGRCYKYLWFISEHNTWMEIACIRNWTQKIFHSPLLLGLFYPWSLRPACPLDGFDSPT